MASTSAGFFGPSCGAAHRVPVAARMARTRLAVRVTARKVIADTIAHHHRYSISKRFRLRESSVEIGPKSFDTRLPSSSNTRAASWPKRFDSYGTHRGCLGSHQWSRRTGSSGTDAGHA